jgi:Fe-S oxidoreductase
LAAAKAVDHHPIILRNQISTFKLKDEPTGLAEKLGCKPKIEEEPYTYCRFCGVFLLKNPKVAAKFWEDKKEKILASGASLIATDCPGCVFQLKANLKKEEKKFRVVHTAQLFAEAGEKNPD